jgi:thiol:disulfide interchange protein DsbA
MKKFVAVLVACLLVACSSEEPASRQTAETTSPPSETAVGEEATPQTPTDDASAAEMAQQLDESESAGIPEDGAEEDTALVALASEADAPQLPERFQKGRHYELLTAAQPTGFGPDKVEVLEIFWYGCPHCYTLEPHIQAWLADGIPAQAEFRRMPASLNRSWQIHARAYFTAEALGILDEFHPAMFEEMNVNRNPAPVGWPRQALSHHRRARHRGQRQVRHRCGRHRRHPAIVRGHRLPCPKGSRQAVGPA